MYVLFLHGPAAAGKLTVARPLAQRLGVRLFHNHLTVDLSTALFDFGTAGFVQLREEIWLRSFSLAAREGVSFVFTFQPEASVGLTFPQDCRAAVEGHGGHVHFVALDCPESAVEERIAASSRAEFGKLRDVELYKQLRDAGAFEYPPMPEPMVRVDTSRCAPEEAVERIVTRLQDVIGRESSEVKSD
ncbi:MAG: shikimate kinase [Acidobacteriota bacterium]